MISNQIIQTCLDDLKAITRVDLGVYDVNGEDVAATANIQKPYNFPYNRYVGQRDSLWRTSYGRQ